MIKWVIEKLGGFPDIDSAINHIKAIEDEEIKEQLLTESVKKLYNAVGQDEILKVLPDGSWQFQGRPLLSSEVAQIQAEAQLLLGMKIWRVLKLDIQYELNKKMFLYSSTQNDLIAGKLAYFLDDVVRKRLQSIKK